MKAYILFTMLCIAGHAFAQNKTVLHYSETSGFDHNTRQDAYHMFKSFEGVNVVHDLDGSSFDTLSSLLNYDLIVFSNTSGSAILDSTQRAHFEQYIQAGGNLMGIHAASDTYRHSSANGSPSGVWDFYAETLGGSVQQNPNHVAGTPLYDMNHTANHPSLVDIPMPWSKNEEYYYWENGYLDTAITVILEVEQTVGPNNQVNSYDAPRAVSWYKTLGSGSRIFYTSMGHANSNYTSDTLFQKHIEQAMNWALGRVSHTGEASFMEKAIKIYPNPASDILSLQIEGINSYTCNIYSLSGQLAHSSSDEPFIDLSDLSAGLYLVVLETEHGQYVKKLVKE